MSNDLMFGPGTNQLSKSIFGAGVDDVLKGSSSDAKQTGVASLLTPGQEKYLDWMTNLLQGNIGAGGVSSYPGKLSAGESALQNLTFNSLMRMLGGGKSGVDTLTGEMSLTPGNLAYSPGKMPLTPEETVASVVDLSSTPQYAAGWNTLQKILNGGLKTDINSNPAYAKGMTALDSILKDFDPGSATEYWQKSFVDPALKTWNEDIAPAVMEKYTAKNAQYSSAAPRALAKSGKSLMTDLSGQLGTILYNAEEAQKNRQATGANTALNFANLPANLAENAAGRTAAGVNSALQYGEGDLDKVLQSLGLGLTAQGQGLTSQGQQISTQQDLVNALLAGSNLDLSRISTALGAGNVEQNTIQNQLNAEFQKWLVSQGYSNPWLQYLGLPLGVRAIEPIVQGPTQTPGLLSSFLGGAGQGGGAAAMKWLLA